MAPYKQGSVTHPKGEKWSTDKDGKQVGDPDNTKGVFGDRVSKQGYEPSFGTQKGAEAGSGKKR